MKRSLSIQIIKVPILHTFVYHIKDFSQMNIFCTQTSHFKASTDNIYCLIASTLSSIKIILSTLLKFDSMHMNKCAFNNPIICEVLTAADHHFNCFSFRI